MAVHSGPGLFGDPHSVGEVIGCLEAVAEEHGRITLGHVVDALGSRTYGPMLLVPALLEITPLGAVPGIPTFLASIIILFAVQMLFGAHHFWIPDFMENRTVDADRLGRVSKKLEPLAARLDRLFHGRMKGLTKPPLVQLAALVVIGLALTVPPLELVPFASSGPMLAIAAVGLALLVRDGLLLLAALSSGVAAVAVGFAAFSPETAGALLA